jgi:hypothetical protein
MECKNCNYSLRTDYLYCPACGAKVIRNRITVKNIAYDISERFFNLDNTFIKTFWHLFTKPHVVIGGYIDGIRKKYMNPISYITIALTLSGILLFFLRKYFKDIIEWNSISNGQNDVANSKIMELMFDYNSFIFLLYIPILAIASYLAINKGKYNLPEYFVTFIYILAQYSILSFPISIGVLLISPEQYLTIGLPLVFFIFFYSVYVLQKMNTYKIKHLIPRSMLYSFLTFVGFIGLIIVFVIVLFVTGVLSLEDFAPPK